MQHHLVLFMVLKSQNFCSGGGIPSHHAPPPAIALRNAIQVPRT